MNELGDAIKLEEILYIILKNIKIVIILPVIFAVIGLLVSMYIIRPIYEASTTLLVNSSKTSQEMTQSDVLLSKSLVYTYAEIAKSQTVIDKTVDKLNINKAEMVSLSVSPLKDTQIIVVSVKSINPALAASIANTIAETFSDEIIRIAKVDSVEIIDEATPNYKKVSPNILLNTILFFIISLTLILTIILLMEYMDKTICTEKDIEKYLDTPLIGVVIQYKTEAKRIGKNNANR